MIPDPRTDWPERAQAHRDDARYHAWIAAIAADLLRGHCKVGIIEHIQKHAVADLNKHVNGDQDWRRWSASMRNLLDIFDALYLDSPMTVSEQLARLQAHFISKPKDRTPEPMSTYETFEKVPAGQTDAWQWLKKGDIIQHVSGCGQRYVVVNVGEGYCEADTLVNEVPHTASVINIQNWRRWLP